MLAVLFTRRSTVSTSCSLMLMDHIVVARLDGTRDLATNAAIAILAGSQAAWNAYPSLLHTQRYLLIRRQSFLCGSAYPNPHFPLLDAT